MLTNTKWTPKNIPDQSGKWVIVTGANSGIGYEAARALAGKGAHVVMACRNVEKAEVAAEKIRWEGPPGEVKVMPLDLADLNAVRQFAAAYRVEHSRLDVLVNNAGVMAIPFRHTADGFEMQFGTNHLGHFALTGLLLDILETTPQSRVVTVSSYAHIIGKINFDNLHGEKFYQRWLAYGQSNLANLLFAYQLQRIRGNRGGDPLSVAVHPGWAATNLQHNSILFRLMNPYFGQSQEMGALPTLYAATSPEIRGGEYIGPDGFLAQRGYPRRAQSSLRSRDESTAKRLWQVSEALTGVHIDVQASS